MTDKQIIIDGVDVSGCAERSMCINCETVTNCYYKQLKRKEQECETLKSYANFDESSYRETNRALLDEIAYLNKELADSKRQHEGDKGLITSTGKMNYQLLQEVDKLKAENKHLNDLLNQALKELEKTRETLTEIKEIAEDFGFNGIYEDCFTGIQKILQKISEVEDGN